MAYHGVWILTTFYYLFSDTPFVFCVQDGRLTGDDLLETLRDDGFRSEIAPQNLLFQLSLNGSADGSSVENPMEMYTQDGNY